MKNYIYNYLKKKYYLLYKFGTDFIENYEKINKNIEVYYFLIECI